MKLITSYPLHSILLGFILGAAAIGFGIAYDITVLTTIGGLVIGLAVGGVAISTMELSTTLNGAITDSVTTITLADGSAFPTSGFIVIEKVNAVSGLFENEVIEYTGRSSNDLTGCTRGTSAPYRGVSPEKTTAGSHATGAKVFGAYKIATLSTRQELAGYNDSAGNPAYNTIQTGFTFELVSNASSTETGGGLQCTIGPINDRG